MKFLAAFYSYVLIVGARVVDVNGREPTRAEIQLWAAVGDFGHSLLNQVVADAKASENVLLSPLSVHSALSMIVPGATAQTRNEILQSLRLKVLRSDDIKSAFTALSARKYEHSTKTGSFQDSQFVMRLANRLYVDKSYVFEQEYIDTVKSTFYADAVNADFAGDTEGVRNEINDFVRNATDGLIRQILQTPLGQDTVMVLVNALYFKGDWENIMSESNSSRTFNAGCMNVQRQHTAWLEVTAKLPYMESADLNAKLVRIPYKSGDFSASMLLVVPAESHSCQTQRWLRGLQWNTVLQEINRMTETKVELTMPRFEMDYRINLPDALQAVGIRQVFRKGEATLGKMLSVQREHFNVDQVIHETKMIVTKYGTEAAAATASSVNRLGYFDTREPTKMKVDKSFYVAILYGKPGVQEVIPLFTGVVHNV